ncbi:SCO7613 C-terminal domain-containing membrane protein [Cellulomonas persica]|uniref:Uncharacterized protein n=1 Tax=Cellulomonas persica TaxID=76861 RepID=A0A510UW11_9CELL|nr:hypothetical protein [Cellulomonas persica]GEK18696.1 hypothetical protein CPE01_24290 [Cellulomonas persica]
MAPTPLEQARRLLLDPSRCPACGAPLTSPRCRACGIDLAGDAGRHVWQVARAAADALAHHAEVVARVRADQSSPTSAAPDRARVAPVPSPLHAVPSPARPVPAPSLPVQPLPGPVPPPPGRLAAPAGDAARLARRPWRVQTVLVTLGAALLALASLVFLVFTWELLTLPVRATLVAVGTAGVLALAVLLARRGLTQSAEAVAALGSALLALDVWALWATGMLPSAPGWLVGGVGLLVCGALLAGYGLRTGLRAGTVAAAVLVPASPLLLIVATEEAPVATTALLTSLGLATLRHHRVVRTRPPERRVLATFAGGTGLAAGLVVTAGLGSTDPVSPGLTVLAAATVAALAVQSRLTDGVSARVWAAGAGLLATLGAALAVPPLADAFTPWSAPAAAVVAAAVVLAAGALPGSGQAAGVVPPGTRRAAVAGATAAVTAGVLALPELALLAAEGVADVVAPDRTPDGACGPAAVTMLATGTLAALVGLRLVRAVRHVAGGLTCLGAFVGVALVAPGVPATVAGLAGLALVAAFVPLPRPWHRHVRTLAVVAGGAAVVASLDGAASGAPTSWAVAHVAALLTATLVALVAGRWGRTPARGGAAAAAVLLLTFALAGVARLVGAGPADAACLAAGLVGTLVVALVLRGLATHPERAAALGVAAGTQALTWCVVLGGYVVASDGTPEAAVAGGSVALVTSLPALAAAQAAVLAAFGHGRVGTPVRQVCTALVAPALAASLLTAHLVAGRPGVSATLVGATVLGCAAALVARATPFRPVLEVSGAVVTAVALAASVEAPAGVATLQLTLAALTAGVVGLAADRRALRWWALGLAVVASWSGLAVRDVGTPEAYAAPLGLVLGAIGVRRVRDGIRTPDGSSARATSGPPLLAAGLLLVGTPPALVDDPLVVGSLALDRTVLLTVAVVTLTLGAVRVAAGPHVLALRTAQVMAACAALLAILGPLRRAVLALLDGASTPVEVWSLPAALVLGLATLAARRSDAGRPVVALGVWGTLLVAAVPTLAAAQGQVDDDPRAALVRYATVALVGTGVALIGVVRGSASLVGPGLTLLGLAGLGGAVAVTGAAARMLPADAVLAVAGALAGVVGTTWMLRAPDARSWPALGAPGLLVLAPVLVGLQVEPVPWRWVVVLVGGTAAVIVGAVRRWQAPFVVGAVVLAVEVVVQLLAAATSLVTNVGWWPLLFLGGAALTVVGVTYEKRMRDAREATRYVARMR